MKTRVVILIGMGAAAIVSFGPLAFLIPAFGGNGGNNAACSTTATATPQLGKAPNNAGLFGAIVIDSGGNNRLQLAMLEGSYLESGWSNTSEGAGSYGPFQIQDPGVVHPDITIAQAENPVYATNYMVSAYRDALNTVDPRLWSTNPEQAAEQTAYGAEKPYEDYYSNRGTAAVDLAYSQSIQMMRQLGLSTKFGTTTVTAAKVAPGPSCKLTMPANVTAARATILKAAASQLGVPYVWGGTTPKGNGSPGAFDCSGLVMWSFAQAGISLPRTSQDQWTYTKGHIVTTDFSQIGKAQPGDLVFFAGSDGTMTSPGHIGIYWTNGEMLAAPQTGENVQIEPIYPQGFVGITDPYTSGK